MEKIAIIYIATGDYMVFWKYFYESFERYFLPATEKHYYIFTDSKEIESTETIHVKRIESLPWPLPTLLKYNYLLKYKDELLQYDYIYQSNANIVCHKMVYEDDFLPRVDRNEKLIFTLHPGYAGKPPRKYPYDRNKQTLAYVPYNRGTTYVFGAMNGGVSSAYISMAEYINSRIIEDLNRNNIARFHDESHVNHFVIQNKNYRLLPIEYCYPTSDKDQSKAIIGGLNKEDYFDVKNFKGYKKPKGLKEVLVRASRYAKKNKFTYVKMIRDCILRRNIAE